MILRTYSCVSGIGGTPPAASTRAGPALYAANAFAISPPYRSSICFKYCVPAVIFWLGSYGSLTRRLSAVAGINCINPIAPTGDTAHGEYADSASTTARTSPASTLFLLASRSMIGFIAAAVTGGQSAGGAGADADDANIVAGCPPNGGGKLSRIPCICRSTLNRCRSKLFTGFGGSFGFAVSSAPNTLNAITNRIKIHITLLIGPPEKTRDKIFPIPRRRYPVTRARPQPGRNALTIE